MPFGTPGGDVQPQAMLQVLLNISIFGADLQEAVEAPRIASASFPSSLDPHHYEPGLLKLEDQIPQETRRRLEELGHTISWWPGPNWAAGSVCAAQRDQESGLVKGAADSRRTAYAACR